MKQFSKGKIQRMRNLVSGDYGAKTKVSRGYTKYENKRKEGDVWEENGKTWTIKNGIKQNKTKLKSAKAIMKIPFKCPKCNSSMNKSAHKKMYRIYGHCLYCQVKIETNMMQSGKYKDWLEKEVRKNFEYWTNEKRGQFERWFESIDSNQYITESGQIEDWSKLTKEDKDVLISRFENWIQDENNKLEKLIKENKDEHIN